MAVSAEQTGSAPDRLRHRVVSGGNIRWRARAIVKEPGRRRTRLRWERNRGLGRESRVRQGVRQGRVLQSSIGCAKLAYLATVRERLADARGRLREVVPGVDYGPDGIDGQGKEEGRCEQQACHQATAVAVTDD